MAALTTTAAVLVATVTDTAVIHRRPPPHITDDGAGDGPTWRPSTADGDVAGGCRDGGDGAGG